MKSRIEIANPCPKKWAEMSGDDRVRFCESCQHNVTDLSNCSPEDLADMAKSDGRKCLRMDQTKQGLIRLKSGWIRNSVAAGLICGTILPGQAALAVIPLDPAPAQVQRTYDKGEPCPMLLGVPHFEMPKRKVVRKKNKPKPTHTKTKKSVKSKAKRK